MALASTDYFPVLALSSIPYFPVLDDSCRLTVHSLAEARGWLGVVAEVRRYLGLVNLPA